MKQVVILGAGISGLTAGWYLHKKWGSQIQLTLLEKENRVGGWIRTSHQNGFLFEQGPRGFRSSGKGRATLDLIRDLRLENKLIAANPLAKKRYILLEGSLRRFSLKLLLKHGFLQGCLKDWKTPACALEDETIAHFFERRFNPRFTETFVDPLVKGIYGGDIAQLSCRSCFPTFWDWEKQKGSLLRGFFSSPKAKGPTLYSFQEGMELLPKTLATKLPASIMLSTAVQKVEKKAETFFIHLSRKTLQADYLISALPSYALAQIFDPFRALLEEIPFVTLSLVHLGWHRDVLKKKGFGFLVPTKEKQALLGMVWDSSIFPAQNRENQTRLTVMVAGSRPSTELTKIALQSCTSHLQITQSPDEVFTHVAHKAIPQYTIGHFNRLHRLVTTLPKNMFILGNSFYGVGMNDCIAACQSISQALPNKI